MSEQEFRRALGYANSAIDLLKRGQIPPYPQFYELLYTYATGVNPTLNARINAIFRDGDPSVDVAERLYNEFLKAQDVNERISTVSGVAQVQVYGPQKFAVRVQLDPRQLASRGIGIDEASDAVQNANVGAGGIFVTQDLYDGHRRRGQILAARADGQLGGIGDRGDA